MFAVSLLEYLGVGSNVDIKQSKAKMCHGRTHVPLYIYYEIVHKVHNKKKMKKVKEKIKTQNKNI